MKPPSVIHAFGGDSAGQDTGLSSNIRPRVVHHGGVSCHHRRLSERDLPRETETEVK